MRRYLSTSAVVAATLIALVVALALAGCGSTAASTSPAASPSAAASGSPSTYLGQAQAILSQVATTAGALPDAVAGLSKKPDDTWTTAGAALNEAAAKLGTEADSLAALTPPSAVKPVQDAVVKGLKAMQAKVNDMSGLIYEQSADEANQKGPIKTQIDSMKTQLQALSAKLSAMLGQQ